MLDTTGILTTLLSTFTAVRDGVQRIAPGQPVGIHVIPPAVDLKIPTLQKGELSLTALDKSVRYAKATGVSTPENADKPDLERYLADPRNVLGGQPIPTVNIPLGGPPLKGAPQAPTVANANPADLGTLPSLEIGSATQDNALSGVPGLLWQLAGSVPIPALAPVSVQVKWLVQKYDDQAPDGYDPWETVLDTDPDNPQDTGTDVQLIGGGANMQFLFSSLFVELTATGFGFTRYRIIASINLSVGDISVPAPQGNHTRGWFDLPPITVDVPDVGVPSLAVLFTRSNFGFTDLTDDDNCLMILMPNNSPIRDLDSLNKALGTVTSAVNNLIGTPLSGVTTFADLALFLAGLGELSSTITAHINVPNKRPVQIVYGDARNGVTDLSNVKYDEEDNFGKQVNSALLVGVEGTSLKLYWDKGYKKGDAMLTLRTGPEMVVGLPWFDKRSSIFPPDVGGSVSADGDEDDIDSGQFNSAELTRH